MRSEGYGSRRVCLSVCLLSHISPLGLRIVVKTLPHTQHATKVKTFVAFSLKLRRSRAMALSALYSYRAVGHFLLAEYARALLKCTLTVGGGLGSRRRPQVLPLAYVICRFICDCQLSLRFSSSFRGRSVLVNSKSSSLQGVTVYSFRLNWSVQTRCLGLLYACPQAHRGC